MIRCTTQPLIHCSVIVSLWTVAARHTRTLDIVVQQRHPVEEPELSEYLDGQAERGDPRVEPISPQSERALPQRLPSPAVQGPRRWKTRGLVIVHTATAPTGMSDHQPTEAIRRPSRTLSVCGTVNRGTIKPVSKVLLITDAWRNFGAGRSLHDPSSSTFEQVTRHRDGRCRPHVGARWPAAALADDRLNFTGTTLSGAPFDGASLQGKPAVLWFWTPWCPFCNAEAPSVSSVQPRIPR